MMLWPLLVKLYFALRLRGALNRLQRRLKGEHRAQRASVPELETPEAVEDYVRREFKWRPDGTRLLGLFVPLDYITHPEVFQARITDGVRHDTGDCDDFHMWVAVALQKVPGVSRALLHSTVWRGGGHTTCLFELRGHWYGFNYRIGKVIVGVESPKALGAFWAQRVLEWAEAPEDALKFWCLETTDHRLVEAGRRVAYSVKSTTGV